MLGTVSGSRGASASRRIAAIAFAVLLAGLAAQSHAHPHHPGDNPLLGSSSLEGTIVGEDQDEVSDTRGDPDRFALLDLGPGEPYVVRDDLTEPQPGRANRRVSLIYLGQLSDFQIADQQSPARVELLDPLGGPVRSAWRPQETLVPHQVEMTIRQLNRFQRSPVRQGDGSRARMENAVMTGDLADNQQLNETRWVKQLLQGGVFVDGEEIGTEIDPNSGSSEVASYPLECQAAVAAGLLDPADADRYVGVQSYDDWPGGSLLADKHNFYDADEPAGLYRNWPRYEGLLDRAQEPFEVEGLEVPFYVLFGNHDGLVQGNQWANSVFDLVAQGCIKAFPAPGAQSLLEEILGGPLLGEEDLLAEALGLVARTAGELPVLRSFEAFVPPDENRRLIDRREFKQVFDNGFQDDAHGFGLVDPDELEASDGAATYYDFSPADGIRYIVLDTVSYGGQFPFSSDGNIDRPQFDWLRRKLEAAQERDELILVFGHHGITSLTSPVPHEVAPPCRDPATGADLQAVIGPGCDRDPRPSSKPGEFSPYQGSDLAGLLLEFPNVVGLVAGHSHNNRVQGYSDGDGGGFWEVKSPAIVDWPTQHRLIELMDNRDGTLSLFGTMLDDGAPPTSIHPDDDEGPSEDPSQPRFELDGETIDGLDVSELSSIGRTLSYNDPQVGPQGIVGERPQGMRVDRNVELLIADPRSDPDPDPGPGPGPGPEPPGDRGPGDGRGVGGDRGGDRAAERGAEHRTAGVAAVPGTGTAPSAAGEDRGLPFTGMLAGILTLVGVGLLAAGRLTRRIGRSGG